MAKATSFIDPNLESSDKFMSGRCSKDSDTSVFRVEEMRYTSYVIASCGRCN